MVNVEIVNIAASGDLDREIDIQRLVEDIDTAVANYDPDFNASFIRFEKNASELVIVYTSGKYIVRGGDTYEKMEQTHKNFLNLFDELGISVGNPSIDVKNVVCVADLEREIDLSRLSLSLGLEETEYEPEQFPGLVYRPSDSPCVLLIFSSGKVVATGGRSREDAQKAVKLLKSEVDDFNAD